MTRLLTLDEFWADLSRVADVIYERRYEQGTRAAGGGNGPGPHWGIRGLDNRMLSPSAEELAVLFLLARALRPRVVVELGTGTGLSALALALGWPVARVETWDNFGITDCEDEARTAWAAGGVAQRIMLCRRNWKGAMQCDVEDVDLVFEDGANTYPVICGTGSQTVYAVHDFGGYHARCDGGWFLDTSSVIGLLSADPERMAVAIGAASLVVPNERIAQIGTARAFVGAVEQAA